MSTVYWTKHHGVRDLWYLSVDNTPVLMITRYEGCFETKIFIDNTLRFCIDSDNLQYAKKKAVCIYKTALNEHIQNAKEKLAQSEHILSCL